MIISQDLRAAIRSAEKSQPSFGWQMLEEQNAATIEAFFKRYPAKAKRVKALLKQEHDCYLAYCAAGKALCEQYGLASTTNEGVRTVKFAHCDGKKTNFVKAGGVLPAKPAERWKFDAVMAELAAADSKDAEKILKRYGINWK